MKFMLLDYKAYKFKFLDQTISTYKVSSLLSDPGQIKSTIGIFLYKHLNDLYWVKNEGVTSHHLMRILFKNYSSYITPFS